MNHFRCVCRAISYYMNYTPPYNCNELSRYTPIAPNHKHGDFQESHWKEHNRNHFEVRLFKPIMRKRFEPISQHLKPHNWHTAKKRTRARWNFLKVVPTIASPKLFHFNWIYLFYFYFIFILSVSFWLFRQAIDPPVTGQPPFEFHLHKKLPIMNHPCPGKS